MTDRQDDDSKLLRKAARLRALGPLAPRFLFGWRRVRVKPGEAFYTLPFKRSWQLIGISGIFLALFCIPYFTVGSAFGGGDSDGLMGPVAMLFSLFWLLSWSVVVAILAALFLACLLGGETVYIRPGQVALRLELLGLGIGVDYKAQGICDLRRESADVVSGTAWRGRHLAFDYGGETVKFGSNINDDQARQIVADINNISIANAAALAPVEPATMPSQVPLAATVPVAPVPVNADAAASLWSLSTWALIIANGVPLVGVLLWGWNIGEIMLLFWAESAVVGCYNLLKMWVIGRWWVLFAGPFFIGHYGAFMVVHLLFIYALFQDGMDNRDSSAAEVFADFAILWPALLALFISHGISYVQNFIGRREYRGRQIRDQMGEPYKRIIVMHVTIIFGGMLTMVLGTLLPALAMLILLKTAVDLKAHLAEHGSGRAGPVNG